MTSKKKILVFIDWFLPGYKAGGPIRSCANLVDHLHNEYDFSIVTRNTDYCETEPYSSVKSDEWNVMPNGVRVYYFSAQQLNRANIRKLLQQEQYDMVYLNGIYSPYFTLIPLFYLRRMNKPVVIASRGMLAKSALSVKSRKKKLFLAFIKMAGLFRNVLFHATTEEEAKDIREQLGDKARIKVAANLPRVQGRAKLVERTKQQGIARIVNIARIAPEKNLGYALEALLSVKSNIEFDLYGPIYDIAYWKQCKKIIDSMPPNVKVNYRNVVEADKIGETLMNYHFMLMPTRGENFGHIILESLSAGCPVIISDQTPWRGLEQMKAGWDLSLNDKEKFVRVIEKCAEMDQQEYDRWSLAAFQYASAFLANEQTLQQNRELFR